MTTDRHLPTRSSEWAVHASCFSWGGHHGVGTASLPRRRLATGDGPKVEIEDTRIQAGCRVRGGCAAPSPTARYAGTDLVRATRESDLQSSFRVRFHCRRGAATVGSRSLHASVGTRAGKVQSGASPGFRRGRASSRSRDRHREEIVGNLEPHTGAVVLRLGVCAVSSAGWRAPSYANGSTPATRLLPRWDGISRGARALFADG